MTGDNDNDNDNDNEFEYDQGRIGLEVNQVKASSTILVKIIKMLCKI